MLKQLNRLKRTQNAFIILFALLLGISLVFFYAPSRGGGAVADNSTVAEVGGDEIKAREVLQQKERFNDSRARQFFTQLGGTRGIVDQLIMQRVVAAEARRQGVAVSDAEVSQAIREVPDFKDANGNFSVERYKRRVADTVEYEQQLRASLAAQKLQALVTAGVQVSPEELETDFKRRNTKFDLIYVPVTADKLAARLNPSDTDLQNFYNANKAEFAISVPQKKIRYLYINQEKAGSRLNIPDEDLRAEYDKLPADRKQAGVNAQQIVLRVARPELDGQVLTKATQLVAELRGTDNATTISEQRFADIARGNSEDPATAQNGGKLNGIVRRNPNKPDDPLQPLLSMQEGEITEPIKIGGNYFIFRRGASVPKSFEDAKQELLVSLRNRRSYAVAAQLAQRANERLKETKNIEQVAQELAAEANMSPSEMLRETDYIKPGDTVPNIGSNPQFEEAIAPLQNAGDTGERVGIPGGVAVPQLADIRPPRTPEPAEIRDQLITRVKQEQARAQVEQVARELAQAANNPDELRARAASLGLEVQEAKDYSLGSPFGTLNPPPASDSVLFALTPNSVTKTPIKIENDYVVAAAVARKEADLTEFAKQRESLMQSALSTEQGQVFADFIAAARRRMEDAGRIQINEEIVKTLAADDPPPSLSPMGAGGLPFPVGQ